MPEEARQGTSVRAASALSGNAPDALAQRQEETITVQDTLLALEEQGWQALADGTGADFYRRYLTDDALMVVPGGVLSREVVLQFMESAPPWAWFRIEAARVLPLTEDSAVVAYQATAQREGQAEYSALMSTVYVRRDGAWKVAFHQQTPV